MNQRSDFDTPNLKSHGVTLEAVGTTSWQVREKNHDQIIARIWLSDYEEKGPSLWLNIADFEPNQMHLLAETIRTVSYYALDRGKIHKIKALVDQRQSSLLAALDVGQKLATVEFGCRRPSRWAISTKNLRAKR